MRSMRRFLTLILPAVALLVAPAARAAALEVGYIPILASAPLLVLEGEGWAKQEGVELKLTRFEAGTAAIQALAAGKLDVIYAGVAPVIVARSKGVDVSVIANAAVEELALVARGPLARLAADQPAGAAVKAFAAQAGRKVKIGAQPSGSVPDTVLRHWILKVAKLDPELVEIVPTGIEKTQQALMAGALDAAMIREPTITIVQRIDPQATVLALGGAMFPDQPGTVVAARGEVIRERPAALQTLVKAHLRAIEAIRRDPVRATALVNEHLGKGIVEPEVLQAALTSPASKYLGDPRRIVGPAERMQAFQVEIGSAQGGVPVGEAFDFRFYDAAAGK